MNKIFYGQWLWLLLLYFISTPTIFAKPQAFFTVSPSNTGKTPFIVTLDGSRSAPSSNPAGSECTPSPVITQYEWRSTAPGFMLSDSVQIKRFIEPGTYTVWLKVTDSTGETDEVSQTITVLSASSASSGGNQVVSSGPVPSSSVSSSSQDPLCKPISNFTILPAQGEAPLTVRLDASTSQPSTKSGTNITGYQWQITPFVKDISPVVQPSLTLTEAGTYTITLTVKNDLNLSTKTSQTITVVKPELKTPLLGEFENASFYGGVMMDGEFLLEDSQSFGTQAEVSIIATIATPVDDQGKKVHLLVAIQYWPTGVSPETAVPLSFKAESVAFPFVAWKLDFPVLFPFAQSAIELKETQNIEIFKEGDFKGLPGKYKVYFGYLLAETGKAIHNFGTSAQPITFEVFEDVEEVTP